VNGKDLNTRTHIVVMSNALNPSKRAASKKKLMEGLLGFVWQARRVCWLRTGMRLQQDGHAGCAQVCGCTAITIAVAKADGKMMPKNTSVVWVTW